MQKVSIPSDHPRKEELGEAEFTIASSHQSKKQKPKKQKKGN